MFNEDQKNIIQQADRNIEELLSRRINHVESLNEPRSMNPIIKRHIISLFIFVFIALPLALAFIFLFAVIVFK